MSDDDFLCSNPHEKKKLQKRATKLIRIQRNYRIDIFSNGIIKMNVELPEATAMRYKRLGYKPKQIRDFIKNVAETKLSRIYMNMILEPDGFDMLDI